MFSDRLHELLSTNQPLTLQDIINFFAEKSFAVLFLLLMGIPALPLPTGGVTHIFEIIVILLAGELILGRKTVWLPERWLAKPLPPALQKSALPRFIKIIKWIERWSRPRLSKIQLNGLSVRIIGFIILVFTVFAFIAPPFSGLDTLPALGVVLLSLALITEDSLLTVVGLIAGCAGISLIIILGKAAFQLL